MAGFRVTKYDPALRSPTGAYARHEWTSVSDVGRMFEGKVVSFSEYMRTEEAYVQAVRCFLHDSGVFTLRVTDVETRTNRVESFPVEIAQETVERARSVIDDTEVSGEDLDRVVRLVLREAVWCRLIGKRGFYVHVGYDYYMYIGADDMSAPPRGLPPGLFVELFESPWHQEADDK